MRHVLTCTALLLVLAWAPALSADDKSKEAVTDEQFVMKASAAGLAEVNLGNLGAQKANNAEVKKFGQRMVDDHTKANKELMTIADKKRFKTAERMDKIHQDAADKLARLQGNEFDREFLRQMVKDHEEAVALFAAKAKDARDEDLKEFAAKTLPTLKEHHKMVQELEKSQKSSTR